MHTAEHLLNGTMVKMIGCKRSRNAHIERKKSKCDYPLAQPLTPEQLQEIENTINNVGILASQGMVSTDKEIIKIMLGDETD